MYEIIVEAGQTENYFMEQHSDFYCFIQSKYFVQPLCDGLALLRIHHWHVILPANSLRKLFAATQT